MMKSKLPNSVLRRIWALSDIDKDGNLDRDEFSVAMFLIDHKLAGNDIPETLPERLIPPSKRMDFQRDHYQGGDGPRRDEPVASYGGDRRDGPGSSYHGGGESDKLICTCTVPSLCLL